MQRITSKYNGKGIVDVDYDMYWEKEYPVWTDMLGRCYSQSAKKNIKKIASYEGCSVDESFRHYSQFRDWLRERWKPGFQLDKDIRVRGNKVYGIDTCLVVSAATNKAFQLKGNRTLPQGIKERYGGNSYSAIGIYADGTYYSRNFKTIEEAHKYWQLSKAKHLMFRASFESEEARYYVVNRANMLIEDARNGVLTFGVL